MKPSGFSWIEKHLGEYLGMEDSRRAKVKCKNGHQWSVRTSSMNAERSWCPFCVGNIKHTLADMIEVAAKRGGKVISTEYEGLKKHLEWECAVGHRWYAIPNNVKNLGSWCPQCGGNVGEELARAAFEELLGKKFERTRRVPELEGLELDGYNDEMRLAFEYQGKQHYEFVPVFHRTVEDFESQKMRDKLTEERCRDSFITLILISYQIPFTEIREYIKAELTLLGYTLTADDHLLPSSEFYDSVRMHGDTNEENFRKVVESITKKGGVCLSDAYLGYRVPLRVRCRMGHEFMATPESINRIDTSNPRFCTVCGGTTKNQKTG